MKRFLPLALLLLCTGNAVLAQDIFSRLIVYSVPGMDEVRVERDIPYKTSGDTLDFALDLYLPPDAQPDDPLPVVVFVNAGGLEVRRWGVYRSWGRLVAAEGMAGVNYDALDPSNTADLRDAVAYLRDHADELGLDPDRIAIWAASRNVPVALPFIADPARDYLRAAVLYYGPGNPAVPLRREVPLLVARAGLDSAHLNYALDRLVAKALREDIDLTFFNYQRGQHAFDVLDDTDESRRIIAATVGFLRDRLGSVPLVATDEASPGRLHYMLASGDRDRALEKMRATYSGTLYRDNPGLAEHRLNRQGYLLLGEDLTDEALAVFRLNVELHPDYANGYDSLGEALAAAGHTAEATRMYERALALDPDGPTGANARAQIERLQSAGSH